MEHRVQQTVRPTVRPAPARGTVGAHSREVRSSQRDSPGHRLSPPHGHSRRTGRASGEAADRPVQLFVGPAPFRPGASARAIAQIPDPLPQPFTRFPRRRGGARTPRRRTGVPTVQSPAELRQLLHPGHVQLPHSSRQSQIHNASHRIGNPGHLSLRHTSSLLNHSPYARQHRTPLSGLKEVSRPQAAQTTRGPTTGGHALLAARMRSRVSVAVLAPVAASSVSELA